MRHSNDSSIKILLLLSLTACSVLVEAEKEPFTNYFIEHPISQSVKLNGTFTLRCRLRQYLFQESPRPLVQWSLNGFGLGVSREDIREVGKITGPSDSRYDLPENLDEGLYDLQVRNALPTDEGKYVCQINHDGNTTISQTADVRVLVQSDAPEMIQLREDNALTRVGPTTAATVKEGGLLRLNCVAKNGKPGAKISWLLRGKPLATLPSPDGSYSHITGGVFGNVSEVRDTSSRQPFLVTTVSKLSIFVTKLEHGLMINCSAQNEGYEDYTLSQAYTTLNVLYPPVVQLQIHPPIGKREFLENDVATIRCSAEGRPDNFTWSWMVNGTLKKGEASSQLKLRLSTDLMHVVVVCIATTFASGMDKAHISFQYGPRFPDSQPLIFAGAIGEPLKMRCLAEGNPKPQMEWRRVGKNGLSAVLTRSEYHFGASIHEQDFGTYMCTARSPGFPAVSKKIILAKKSSPHIKPMGPVYAAVGTSARLPCAINAIPLPPPEGLLWFRRDIILRQSAHRIFSTEEFLGGVVFVLSFKHVLSTDYGFYNCSAVNAYGSAWQTIELRRDDELSISSLSGILAALLVTIILALVIFFCCRRRQYRKSGVIVKNADTKPAKPPSLMLNGSCGFMQSNHLPATTIGSENGNFHAKSLSESTEAESFSHYQYHPTSLPTVYGQPTTPTTDQVSLRNFSPVCKYTLIDSQGKQIPVCTNLVALNGDHPASLQLAESCGGGSGVCISSKYQTIPVSYVNLPVATRECLRLDAMDNSNDEVVTNFRHLGFVPVSTIPLDSDVIINTQVTSV